jgi:hypothetical protein
MHVARHPTRHLPRCDRARIEKRAINGGARRLMRVELTPEH